MASMLPTSRSTSPVTVYINDVYYVLTPPMLLPMSLGPLRLSKRHNSSRFITLSDSPTVFADVNRPFVQSHANLEDHSIRRRLGLCTINHRCWPRVGTRQPLSLHMTSPPPHVSLARRSSLAQRWIHQTLGPIREQLHPVNLGRIL